MISTKMKLLFAALAVAALAATPMLARTDHKGAATVGQGQDHAPVRADRANPVLGPDGKLSAPRPTRACAPNCSKTACRIEAGQAGDHGKAISTPNKSRRPRRPAGVRRTARLSRWWLTQPSSRQRRQISAPTKPAT